MCLHHPFFPCVCTPSIKTSKWHMIHIFSVRLCVFKCEDSSLSKAFLFFVKIVSLCAENKRMKVTRKKMYHVSFECFKIDVHHVSFECFKKDVHHVSFECFKKDVHHVSFWCFYARRTDAREKWHITPILILGLFTSIAPLLL